jgi:RNA polymerase sigma factor (sigma-70 family)
MTANGRLYPGQVDFADLLDEVVTRAWLQFADRPRWISLDLWLTKLLDETLEEWAKEAPRIHGALQDHTGEALPQNVPQVDDQEWWACLLGEDETVTQDNAIPSRDSPAIDECLEVEELMYRIHTLLGELPTEQRHAFVLNVLEAYGLSEIAMLQDRPETEVQTDIESARNQLRERLRTGARPQSAADDAVGVLATGSAEKT